MKNKLKFCILAFMFTAVITLPAARADLRDQSTKITFSQAVQVPGHILPAGTYWFVILDSTSDRDTVRIFNSDRTHLITTILTIPAQRSNPADATTITLAEHGSMQPAAIVSWYYPGNSIGHEFVYSRSQEQELAHATDRTVMASAYPSTKTAASGD
jgi:hypothetical protein